MSRYTYVNGRYAPLHDPLIEVQDRGFQFADAVYEVWPVREGMLLDCAGHLARLARSLNELSIAQPMSDAALVCVARETLRRNRVINGIVYLQISRGAPQSREHTFPSPAVKPTLVVTAQSLSVRSLDSRAAKGISAITAPDIRWGRCDIKTVGLLPNALAREAAKRAGGSEAILVDAAGFITEGAATNVFIVDQNGILRTRDLSNAILHGITRKALLEAAQSLQIPIEERAFTVEEATAAREVFVSSAGMAATAVVALDGERIGEGTPGPLTTRIREAYFQGALAAAREEASHSVARRARAKL